MKLVVGLGNPGRKYQHTRHNLGFMVLDALAEKIKFSFSDSEKMLGQLARVSHTEHDKVFFLKPHTFMNLSGQSVGACSRFYKIEPADLLVIHDDLDLAFAKCRFVRNGRSAGHNGVESIVEHLGTLDFPRLKIGIGRPPFPDQEPSEFVLQRFLKEEIDFLTSHKSLEHWTEAVLTYLDQGLSKAMEKFN